MEQSINSFLQHLIVEKGFSRNTSEAYRNDLCQFYQFFQDHTKVTLNGSSPWHYVDLELLNKYISDLRGNKGYRDTTTARKVAALKSFFGFLTENGTVTEDPTQVPLPGRGRQIVGYCIQVWDQRRAP